MIIKIGHHAFIFTFEHKIMYTIPERLYIAIVEIIGDDRPINAVQLLRRCADRDGFGLSLNQAWEWIDGGCRGRVLEAWRKDSSGMEFDT